MDEVTDETFQRDVLQAERPVIVDFWAPWCGPCRAVEPILSALAAESDGRVAVVKLDIDKSWETASGYSVLSIPTAILFADGKAQETVVGARSRAYYERAFAPWLAA